MPFVSQAQRAYMYSQHPDIAKRWEKETPKGKLPKHVKPQKSKKFKKHRSPGDLLRKYKWSVDNKMKWLGETDTEKKQIRINVKKHRVKGKLDKKELRDTIEHEKMHARHPKMHEKTVQKKIRKYVI